MASSIVDVAKLADVAISTVSKYMSGGNVKPELAARIHNAIEELNYSPNPIARGLKKSKTFIFGILVPTSTDIFSGGLASKLSIILEQKGYGLLQCDYNSDRELFRKKAEFLESKKIDGVFIFPEGLSADDVAVFQKRNIPIIAIDSSINGLAHDMVTSDNYNAGYECGAYLTKHGHKNAVVLCSLSGVKTSDSRRDGFISAFKDAGYTIPSENILYNSEGDETDIVGFVEKIKAEQSDVTAVFSVNYHISVKTVFDLLFNDIQIGKDMSFISVDNIFAGKKQQKIITCAMQDTDTLAETSAELMFDRMSEEKDVAPRRHTVSMLFNEGKTVCDA